MISEIQIFQYEGQEIEFDTTNPNLMVNATEMAKIFGTDPSQFLRNETTKKFIDASLSSADLQNSEQGMGAILKSLGIQKRDDLYVSNQRHGTWMHRLLALKFAAWLDPQFELWIYLTIDKILQSRGPVKQEATVERKVVLSAIEERQATIRNAEERIKERNAEDTLRIAEARKDLAKFNKQLNKLNREDINQLNVFVQQNEFADQAE